ncbi:DAK2 domain-containing protein [soil metagenome]
MPDLERLDVAAFRHVLTSFRDAVRDHAATLDLLNVYPVPDGDTGTNMARTLDAVVIEMESAAADLDATCDAISHGSLMGARGNSGVILSQILRGVATTLKQPGDHADPAAGARRFADALAAATTGAYQAVLKPVEGTILTVVRESAEAATAAADAGMALIGVVEAAHAAGRDSLARTPDLLPVLRDAGVVDAGGAGFLLFLDAALHVLTGRPLPEAVAAVPVGAGDSPESHDSAVIAFRDDVDRSRTPAVSGVDGELDVSEQRYEVMYLCDLADEMIDRFKGGWGAIGDSIVVVGGDGLWNCHVHTNDIGAAVEVALDLGGRPRRIRVTDLFEEVAEGHAARDATLSDSGHVGDGGDVGDVGLCAVVAVASGAGLATLFRDLGVAQVVMGGQTSNPSTAELLAAVERVPATSVVLLSNNKNIIAVAEQVDGLTTKSVRVVPTRSMPEALPALMVFDARVDHVANERRMTDAVASVATGEVTRAVRDSRCAAGPVAEGDWIGLVAGDGIVAVADHLLGASTALLDHLLDEGHELLTMITGAGATAGTTAALEGWLSEHHAHIEVEVHEGGQPLYPYLFGVE